MNSSRNIKNYAGFFKGDSVVLFPTDTVIGLGCRYDSAEGIARIRKIKKITDKNPLAVLIADQKQLDLLKVRRSRITNLLMDRFWPGGLTIVLTSEQAFPCSGEGNTLGLRMPDVEFLRRIIEATGVPIAATSANYHGQPSPARLEDLAPGIKKSADHIIDFEVNPVGLASTVVKIEGGLVNVLREGTVTRAEILEAVGEKT